MSSTVGLLCNDLLSALLSHVELRQSHIIPLGLGTSIQLLHHSAVSSIPNGTMIATFAVTLNSFLGYGLKCPMHEKTANSLCIDSVSLALALISASLSGSVMK